MSYSPTLGFGVIMESDAILILSYPDTEFKLRVLNNLLDSALLAKIPITLATHYPVPNEIIKKVDFFIYDKEDNMETSFKLKRWFKTSDFYFISEMDAPHAAIPCFSSIRNGAEFLVRKFRNVHYFEHDSIVDFVPWINLMKNKLADGDFAAKDFHYPDRGIDGIYGTWFSFRPLWWLNNIPVMKTWEDYRSHAKNFEDGLISEHWTYHYFKTHGLLRDCRFITDADIEGIKLRGDIQTVDDVEPGLRTYLSETTDHRLLVIANLYDEDGRSVPANLEHNGVTSSFMMTGGSVYWNIIEKKGHLKIYTKHQCFEYDIDPDKRYTATKFKFTNKHIKCLEEPSG